MTLFKKEDGTVCNSGIIFLATVVANDSSSYTNIVEELQETLYDVIGASGHFRIVPEDMSDLDEDYIYTGKKPVKDAYLVDGKTHIDVAFLVTNYNNEVSLDEEIEYFNNDILELNDTYAALGDLNEFLSLATDKEDTFKIRVQEYKTNK